MRRQPPFALVIVMLCILVTIVSANRSPFPLIVYGSINDRADTFTDQAFTIWVSEFRKALNAPGPCQCRRIPVRIKNKILRELDILSASNQVYHIFRDSTYVDSSSTTFNDSSRQVVIGLNAKDATDLLAHELLHAYQFETGLTSLGSRKTEGAKKFLLDTTDEYQTYERQQVFKPCMCVVDRNGPLQKGNYSIYNFRYKDTLLTYFMKKEDFKNLNEVADSTKQAYRAKVNGKWYTFPQSKQ